MKIVIWGLGFRGKTLADCLGKQYVAAIIESDLNKVGDDYQGIDVISFETYMENYQMFPIIISPGYQFREEISNQLIGKNINHFVFCGELPASIRYNGKLGMKCYREMLEGTGKLFLYGINAFSVVLYLTLSEYVDQIIFVAEEHDLKKNQLAIAELLQLSIVDKKDFFNSNHPIYITTHEYKENVSKLFPGKKVIDAFRYADFREEYRRTELEKFHNIYLERKRCFIVATGPSLTMDDLNTLSTKNEFCFSVNSMCKIQTKWKPDVYVVSDGKFFLENQKMIKDYDCPIKFLPDDDIDFWKVPKEGEYQMHRDIQDLYDVQEFSEDITQIVNTVGTVTVGCIQIAVYMGFKQIYLLGTDCNYVMGATNNYFGEQGKKDMIDHSISEMLSGYQMCKDYADSHGIKIYNATRGGMLEVFERVDFDSLFEQ